MFLSVPMGDAKGPRLVTSASPTPRMSRMVALASTRRLTPSWVGDTSSPSHPGCMTLCPHSGDSNPLQPFWVGDGMGGNVGDSV